MILDVDLGQDTSRPPRSMSQTITMHGCSLCWRQLLSLRPCQQLHKLSHNMFMVCVCTMKWTVPSEWHWSGDCIFASVQIFYLSSSGYSISKGREGNVQDCFWELCLLHFWLFHRFQKKIFPCTTFFCALSQDFIHVNYSVWLQHFSLIIVFICDTNNGVFASWVMDLLLQQYHY